MPNITANNSQSPQLISRNATAQSYTLGPNPIAAANDFILLPIYCMGIVMNGAILLGVLLKWRTMNCLSIRIEKVAAILILVCFLWSVDSAARYAIPEVTGKDINRRVQGILSSGFILLLQGLNITFAIERFLIVKRWKNSSILKAILWQWLAVAVFLVTVTVTFTTTSMVDDSLTPDIDNYIIWIVSMGLAFLITLISTVTLHSLTYRCSLKELKQALESIPSPAPSSPRPSDGSSDSINSSSTTTVTNSTSHKPKMLLLARLNRRMLFRCVIMNATLLICHTPLIVLNLVGNFIYDEFTAGVCTAVGFVFMASEAVITPLMVLYFFPRFQTLFVQKVGLNQAQVETEEEARKNESSLPAVNPPLGLTNEPVAPETSAPKFHIIRIVV
ncbi:hypothetical protein HDU78_008119 [Chytriomyces hyalinus]|nr:hypothetical protein HDU78_008119 [Chytriomyces hyalinus]